MGSRTRSLAEPGADCSGYINFENALGAKPGPMYSGARTLPVDATISTPQQTQRRRLSGIPGSRDLEVNEKGHSIPDVAVAPGECRITDSTRGTASFAVSASTRGRVFRR
jgi:hypothetical protein